MNATQLLIEDGVDSWNQWRAANPHRPCRLEGQDLSGGYFFEGDFSGVNLRGANLQRACLIGADLRWADLRGANLSGAYLDEANFYGANLNDATFTGASLERVNLRRVHWLGKQMSDRETDQLSADLISVAPSGNLGSSTKPVKPTLQNAEKPLNVAQGGQNRDSRQFVRSLAWQLRPQIQSSQQQTKLHPILGLGAS